MQDVVNALLLCETIYKVVDGGPVVAARALNELAVQFGQLASLTGLQFALPHVTQRFLLAQSKDALYVCFMVRSLALRRIDHVQHAAAVAQRLLCPMHSNLARPGIRAQMRYFNVQGTKQLADLFVDINLRQASLWEDKDTEVHNLLP